MRFKIYNHNDTFLGEFNTLEEAFKEANFYQNQTGNSYFIDDTEEEQEELEVIEVISNEIGTLTFVKPPKVIKAFTTKE